MDQSTPVVSKTSTAVTKTIYIIRHGVAYHNVPDARTGERPNLLDPKYTDPSLIRQGELQTRVLGEQLRRRGVNRVVNENAMNVEDGEPVNCIASDGSSRPPQPIELVVCSPLTRCLQTASYVFPSYFNGSVVDPSSQSVFSKISDTNGNDLHVLNGNCRVCCHGDVREAYGMHYPDKRSPLSQLNSQFPTVAYHPSLTEHDADWKHDTRETRQDVSRRVHNFFVWLLQQPHDNVAIVTHGVWMECALLNYCPEVLEFGKKRVYNCDVYHGKLSAVWSLVGGNGDGGVLAFNDVKQMSFYHA